VEPSKQALKAYADQVYRDFAETPVRSYAVGEGMEGLGTVVSLKDMLSELEKAVRDMLAGNEVQ
jgi:CRISPR system Cascade subunit CasC